MKGHKLWLWRPIIKKCFISRNVVFKEYEFFKDDREVSSNKEMEKVEFQVELEDN